VNRAIDKGLAGFSTTLETIPGRGPIYSAGIFAEIGGIDRFESEENLARYALLAWRKTPSGNFKAEDTPLQRQSNVTLRYDLVEAANRVKNRIPEYQRFYDQKDQEASKRKHQRA